MMNGPEMSYAEYLAYESESGLSEWVKGAIIVYNPPTILHQQLVVFLVTLLKNFVRLHQLGRVLTAPVTMRAMPNGNAREPDVLFLATEHVDRLTETELNGPADLVIEVISTESMARDRVDKFYEYQEGGVREYWMLDPRPSKERVDFYVLDEHGRYQPVPVPTDGIYHSTVLPRFALQITWLWQDDPNPLQPLAAPVSPRA
ncbi:MAG: Uma2 family endonuclease [Herpetosiphonaceae bacterium]|nr:Uma2 family endonuclease [Herpetosiphonaceae bacterium]